MKKTKSNPLSEKVIELIKVTPEMTKRVLDQLPYTITPRPENEKAPRGKPVWCPYCGEFTKATSKGEGSTPRLECCGISTIDWHVKTVNHLWHNSNKNRD